MTTGPAPGRKLGSYLLVPRPRELVTKAVFSTVAFVLGLVTWDASGLPVVAVVVALVTFEYVAYQARYVANDLLDAGLDADHPQGGARGRLPDGSDPTVRRVALATIGLRAAVAAAVILTLPGRGGAVTLAAIVVLSVLAAGYETVRRALRRPVPVSAIGRLDGPTAGLFVLVGSGYALRVGVGLALAGLPLRTLVAATAYAWPFGVAFVTMSWALEATAFIAPDWGSLDDRLCRKRHLAVLVRMGGFLDARRHGSVESPTSAKLLAPAAPLSAPWSIGVLLSCAGTGVLAANLSSRWQPDGYAPWAWIALVAVGALAGGTALVLSPIKQVGRVICVIVLAAAVSVVIAASQHVALAAMTWVPIVLLLGPVTIVRRMSYADVLGLRPARWTRPRDPREPSMELSNRQSRS